MTSSLVLIYLLLGSFAIRAKISNENEKSYYKESFSKISFVKIHGHVCMFNELKIEMDCPTLKQTSDEERSNQYAKEEDAKEWSSSYFEINGHMCIFKSRVVLFKENNSRFQDELDCPNIKPMRNEADKNHDSEETNMFNWVTDTIEYMGTLCLHKVKPYPGRGFEVGFEAVFWCPSFNQYRGRSKDKTELDAIKGAIQDFTIKASHEYVIKGECASKN